MSTIISLYTVFMYENSHQTVERNKHTFERISHVKRYELNPWFLHSSFVMRQLVETTLKSQHMLSISFYGGSDIGLENRLSLYIQNALVLCYFGLLASSDQLVSELNTEKSVIHECL